MGSFNVTIRQGTVLGKYVDAGTYPEPLEAFMGMPYALPPVGQLRFRHAVPVPASDDRFEAYQLGPRCPGEQLIPFVAPDFLGPDTESEDCLSVNIWRPRGHTSANASLPVAVLIPGGAFNRGAARMHDTPGMLAWSEEPFIGVSIQYRVGVGGGLNTGLTEKEGLLNLGMKDIILALEWVQDNIAAFGGDPDDVTILGLSAAAHVIGHLVMDMHLPRTLFHKAIMDSGAHTHETLPCLRALPSSTVVNAGQAVFELSDPSVRWAWQPVLDGEVISRRPIDAWKSGRGHKVPMLVGFATNESTVYVPRKASASEDFVAFFRELLPHPTAQELKELETLYPDPLREDSSPYVETRDMQALGIGPQYRRAEAAYGNYAYSCPVRQTTAWGNKNAADPPVYLYHWALNKTATYGANHGDQMRYQTYNPEVRSISPAQDEVAGLMHAYVTSFITGGNPNKASSMRFPKRLEWLPWSGDQGSADKGKTMVFGKGNDEKAGGTSGGVSVQFIDDDWRKKECEFWWRLTERFED
ncbi:putative Extracellular lipase [Seiridium cardinale]